MRRPVALPSSQAKGRNSVLPRPPGPAPSCQGALDAPDHEGSIWRSPGGSLYLFDGDAFTCIAVHARRFHVWVGKRAIARIRRTGALGQGLQAFRCLRTGRRVAWVSVQLHFAPEVIIKRFPAGSNPGHLVHGPVETYVRVRVAGSG